MAYRDIRLLNDNSTRQYSSIGGAAPALAQAGDKLLICAVQGSGVNTFTITSSGPTAPVLRHGPDVINSNETVYLWSLTMAAGDVGATYTISAASGAWFVGAIVAISNASSATPIVAEGQNTSASTTGTSPTITTTVNNSDVVNFWVARAASSTTLSLTAPSGHTKAGEANTTNTGTPVQNYLLAVTYRTTPGAAGSYGGTTATFNQSTTGAVMYTVGLAPNTVTSDPGLDFFYVDAGGQLIQCSLYYADAAGTLQLVSDRTA